MTGVVGAIFTIVYLQGGGSADLIRLLVGLFLIYLLPLVIFLVLLVFCTLLTIFIVGKITLQTFRWAPHVRQTFVHFLDKAEASKDTTSSRRFRMRYYGVVALSGVLFLAVFIALVVIVQRLRLPGRWSISAIVVFGIFLFGIGLLLTSRSSSKEADWSLRQTAVEWGLYTVVLVGGYAILAPVMVEVIYSGSRWVWIFIVSEFEKHFTLFVRLG